MHSRSNWNLEVLVFKEREKPEYLEKNFAEQVREPTTNSTHIWHRHQDSNLGHIGGRCPVTTVPPLLTDFPSFVHWNTKILHFLSQKPSVQLQYYLLLVFILMTWEILSFIATIILPYKLLFLPSRIPLVHPCNPLLRQIVVLTLVRWFLLNLFQPFTSSSWSANNSRTNWGGGGGRNFCRKGFLRNIIASL